MATNSIQVNNIIQLQNSINNTIVNTIRPSMFRVSYNARINTINITNIVADY